MKVPTTNVQTHWYTVSQCKKMLYGVNLGRVTWKAGLVLIFLSGRRNIIGNANDNNNRLLSIATYLANPFCVLPFRRSLITTDVKYILKPYSKILPIPHRICKINKWKLQQLAAADVIVPEPQRQQPKAHDEIHWLTKWSYPLKTNCNISKWPIMKCPTRQSYHQKRPHATYRRTILPPTGC